MENNSLQFKTNLTCGGCVSKVKPYLDNAKGISDWKVDTTNQDKILTVKSDGITEQEVVEIIEKVGFKIRPLGA